MKIRKDKLIGAVISALSLLILVYALSLILMYNHMVIVLLLLLVSVPLLKTGYKLLRYPSPIPVAITEIAMSVKPKILIDFSGMDGTGKSTHARALKEKLEKLGIPCEIVWTRWRPIITYPIMGFIYVLKRWRRKDYHKSKILRKIWAYLTILDFAYFHLFKIKPHLIKGKVIICDRYIYDHIADLLHDGLYNDKAVKLLLKLIPNPNLSFIFDVPVSAAMVRKPDTQDVLNIWRFEESAEEYLNEQRGNYLKVAKKLGIEVIDSTTDFKELNNKIFNEIIKN